MNQSQTQRAIPFIIKNNQGYYQLTKQAQNLITKINTPISIVTVAGLYRTGKSFLLNRVIINKSKGFNVGPTVNPCTKGLWIWNQPIYTTDNVSVLVVDTQGLGALDEQTNHDTKIFCLAVLLSTTFLYNSVGSIDQGALQNLSLVLNLVNSIDQDQQSNRPSFIWVVRDFALQLINEKGATITSKQYLEMALNTDIVKEHQKVSIRKTIINAFAERDCFTLIKPLIDETKLQNLDNVPLDDLRPQFVTQTMILRKKIFSTLKQFKLNNRENLKGSQYIMMTKKYIAAINEGKIPNLIDTWTFIKQEKCRQVLQFLQQECLQKVNSKLIPKLPLKDENIKDILAQLYSQLLTEFKNNTYHQTSTQQLEYFWQKIKRQILTVNQQKRKQTLKNIFTKQYQGFGKKLNSQIYNQYQDFSQDLKNNFKAHLLNVYGQKIDGFEQALQYYCQKKQSQGLKIFFNKQKLQIKKLIQIKHQIQISYQKQFKEIEQGSNNQKKHLKNQLAQYQKILFEKQQQNNQKQAELITKKNQFEIQKQKMKNQKDQVKNVMQGLKHQILTYKNKIHESQTNFITIKKEFQKEKALFSQKQQHMQAKVQEYESKYKQTKMQFQANGGKFQSQKKGIMTHFQQKMKEILKQNKQKSQKIFDLQNQIEDLKQKHEKLKENISQVQKTAQQQKKTLKQKLVNDLSSKKQSFSFELQESKKEINRLQQNYNRVIIQSKQAQLKYKQILDQIKQVKSNSEKQIAIHLQKIQFQLMQISELKITNDQLKKSYQKAMDTIQECSKNSQNKYQMKIMQISQQYKVEMKKLQKQFQYRIKQAKNQNYVLNKQKQDLQVEISIQKNKFQAKVKQFKEYYQKMESNYQNLSMKYNSSEKDYKDISEEKQAHFIMKIKQMENQIESNKEKYSKQLDQVRRTSEESLSILKNYSQMERQQSDRRLLDQRQKFAKKLKSQLEEMDKKMNQEKQSLEQQISILQQKLQSQQKFYNEKIQNMKYDFDIQLQKKINQFGQERVQLNKKNALLNQQIQITRKNLESKLQQTLKTYQQRELALRSQLQVQYEQNITKLKDEKIFLQQKLQTLKKNNRQVQQSNLMLKNDLDKERALFKQKQHNYLKQINDLQSRLSNQIISHNKNMEEYTISTQAQRAKLNSEINQLKISKSKIQEQKSTLRINFEQQLITHNSKINYLESRCRGKEDDYNTLMEQFQVTTRFLTKNNQNLSKQLTNIKTKLHGEFQAKLKLKEEQVKKNVKDLQDRIFSFQKQIKQLKDKKILLQIKCSSKQKNESESYNFYEQEKLNYEKQIEEMRIIIQKLKKDNKFLKNQKELIELNQSLLNQSKLTSKDQKFQKSQRESIINGLTPNTQFSRSRFQDDFSKSKINYTDMSRYPNSQVQGKRLSFLTQNKNIVNMRGQNYSPLVSANKYQRRTKNY